MLQREAKRNQFTKLGGREEETKGRGGERETEFFDSGGRANVEQLLVGFFKMAPYSCLFLDLYASPPDCSAAAAASGIDEPAKDPTDFQNSTETSVYGPLAKHWLLTSGKADWTCDRGGRGGGIFAPL